MVDGDGYGGIKSKAEVKAKKTIMSLLKFYLSENIIEEEEYVEAKVNLDTNNLTQLDYAAMVDISNNNISITLMLMAYGGDTTKSHDSVRIMCIVALIDSGLAINIVSNIIRDVIPKQQNIKKKLRKLI